jgi:hypothetical protein
MTDRPAFALQALPKGVSVAHPKPHFAEVPVFGVSGLVFEFMGRSKTASFRVGFAPPPLEPRPSWVKARSRGVRSGSCATLEAIETLTLFMGAE